MTAVETPTASTAETDLEAFVGKTLGDLAGSMATNLACLGDALGLWKNLATDGPATSEQLAARADVAERYAREWLVGVHAAGYVEFDAGTGVYTLPPAAIEVFAHEGGPAFFGGFLQMGRATALVFDELCDAFRTGGGVPQTHYTRDLYEGISRFTAGWFENLLVPVWLPLLPDVEVKLANGCDVADVGTGAGTALITLAQHYPHSRYVGFDVFEGQVELARANAETAGVSDRVRFEVADIAAGLPGAYERRPRLVGPNPRRHRR